MKAAAPMPVREVQGPTPAAPKVGRGTDGFDRALTHASERRAERASERAGAGACDPAKKGSADKARSKDDSPSPPPAKPARDTGQEAASAADTTGDPTTADRADSTKQTEDGGVAADGSGEAAVAVAAAVLAAGQTQPGEGKPASDGESPVASASVGVAAGAAPAAAAPQEGAIPPTTPDETEANSKAASQAAPAKGAAGASEASDPKGTGRTGKSPGGPVEATASQGTGEGPGKTLLLEAATTNPPSASGESGQSATIARPSAQATGGPVVIGTGEVSQQAQAANVARVVRGLYAAAATGGGAVTLRLSPPEMGVVRVELEIQQGQVRAELLAQQDAARELLGQRVGELRQALERQGFVVERLHVETLPSQPSSPAQPAGHDPPRDSGWQSPPDQGHGRRPSDQPQPRARSFEAELLDTLA